MDPKILYWNVRGLNEGEQMHKAKKSTQRLESWHCLFEKSRMEVMSQNARAVYSCRGKGKRALVVL